MNKKSLVAILGLVAILISIALIIRAEDRKEAERRDWAYEYGNIVK